MHLGTRFTNLKGTRILLTNQLTVQDPAALLHFIDYTLLLTAPYRLLHLTILTIHLKQLPRGTMVL
jgi:hypothetical protein